MNKDNLYQLHQLAKGKSILYVEDSITLQKQVKRLLGKIFTTFHQAYDGLEGYEKYKKFKPDILLTDLTMPKKNGIEMIVDIKEVNPDAKIVILSAHNDDVTLLKTIDMGIVDFLLKPINLDKLTLALSEAILQDSSCEATAQTLHDLKIIYEQKGHLKFLNSFKGIPMVCDGTIIDVNETDIIVQIPHSQAVVMKYEKNTIIELEITKRHIKAYVVTVDTSKNIARLVKPNYTKYVSRQMESKRLAVDKSFKVGIYFQKKNLDAAAMDISSEYISVYIESDELEFKEKDQVDVNIGFEIKKKTALVNETKFHKAFCNGTIVRVEPFKQGYKIVAAISVNKAGERVFGEYLHQRELEIIQELKHLVRK